MRTVAAILVETGQPLVLESLEIPRLRPGQVLVKVAWSGVCHTQLNEVRGRKGADRFLPHTLGHEGSGTVVDVGPGVTKVRPGDAVILTWLRGSGAEASSTQYRRHDGSTVNSGAVSTFLEHAVVSENRLVRLPYPKRSSRLSYALVRYWAKSNRKSASLFIRCSILAIAG